MSDCSSGAPDVFIDSKFLRCDICWKGRQVGCPLGRRVFYRSAHHPALRVVNKYDSIMDRVALSSFNFALLLQREFLRSHTNVLCVLGTQYANVSPGNDRAEIAVERFGVHVRIYQENSLLSRKYELTEGPEEVVRRTRTEGLTARARQLVFKRGYRLMHRSEDDPMIRNSVEVARHAVHGDSEENHFRTVPRRNYRGRTAKPSKLLLAVRPSSFQRWCYRQKYAELLEQDQSVHMKSNGTLELTRGRSCGRSPLRRRVVRVNYPDRPTSIILAGGGGGMFG